MVRRPKANSAVSYRFGRINSFYEATSVKHPANG